MVVSISPEALVIAVVQCVISLTRQKNANFCHLKRSILARHDPWQLETKCQLTNGKIAAVLRNLLRKPDFVIDTRLT